VPIRDTRLMAKAVEQRWPMTAGIRRGIITKLIQVMASPDSSPREVTSAAKALMAAEKQNQEDEHKVVDVALIRHGDELSAIAAELGVSFNLPAITVGQAGSGIEAVEATGSGDNPV